MDRDTSELLHPEPDLAISLDPRLQTAPGDTYASAVLPYPLITAPFDADAYDINGAYLADEYLAHEHIVGTPAVTTHGNLTHMNQNMASHGSSSQAPTAWNVGMPTYQTPTTSAQTITRHTDMAQNMTSHHFRPVQMPAAWNIAMPTYQTPTPEAQPTTGHTGADLPHQNFPPPWPSPLEAPAPPQNPTPSPSKTPTLATPTTTTPAATEKKLPCSKCDEKFPDRATLKAHNKAVHQIWRCDWPGCKRRDVPFHQETSYRRHMREIHQVEVATDKQKRGKAKAAESQEQLEPMQAYLQGAGNRLPADLRLAARWSTRGEGDMPDDVASLKEDNRRLREMVDRLGEELRKQRAGDEEERRREAEERRKEVDEMFRAHQEELKKLRQNDEDWVTRREEMKELRERLRVRQEHEIRKLEDHHERNERRLWNLLNQ
ncbi:hypothetical protein CONLIGDRAFT_674770 [Coniochaeta ligniaria NRRL 30616]|uniref:C2H2-type domain-containing protein n=1 Tax=Coniochaeta ligniaria NRRL 30616 TaxID=1408157 RepID=A0A1J7I5C1_9PEZI|nr:hypothetical protein CONLIGDRAFT_674770 [Coniochaeta ligniaria NRRL 30616]